MKQAIHTHTELFRSSLHDTLCEQCPYPAYEPALPVDDLNGRRLLCRACLEPMKCPMWKQHAIIDAVALEAKLRLVDNLS